MASPSFRATGNESFDGMVNLRNERGVASKLLLAILSRSEFLRVRNVHLL